MIGNVDILGLWEMFIGFLDRVVAWLVFIFGGGEWNPGAVGGKK